MFEQNPYIAGEAETEFIATGEIGLPAGQDRGLVGHVPVLGVLMIVQGVLVLFYGVIMVVLATFMPTLIAQMQIQPGPQNPNGMDPTVMSRFMLVAYGVMAVVLLLMGTLNTLSGFRLVKFQGRVFAIVSLCLGFGTIISCYCFPTAMALAIYGLIVLLNQPVITAFELGRQGFSSNQIQRAFARLYIRT